jgi:hypothetical protein
MPEKKKSKLLSPAEPDWPDVRDKYRRIGIPAVRAAVMPKEPVERGRRDTADNREEALAAGARREGRR